MLLALLLVTPAKAGIQHLAKFLDPCFRRDDKQRRDDRKRWHATKPLPHIFLILLFSLSLTACGFHFRGNWQLPPSVHTIYIESDNPYGQLVRELQQQLKSSNVLLVDNKNAADLILRIEQDTIDQSLLGINATQQTRQYKLTITIRFSLSDNSGLTILPTKRIEDNRIITIQSNQILGSTNEVLLFAQQMRRSLSINILTALTAQETIKLINQNSKKQMS